MSKYGFWARMLEMLTGAYNRSDIRSAKKELLPETNIGRLFYLIAEGLEIIFENAERVKEWDNLDNAQGAVLDRYGANYGVVRGGANDALYRIFIKVKMIAQLSGGDDAAVINAAAELLGVEYSDICLEDVFPAKKMLYVDMSLLSEERLEIINQIVRAIKRILIAGVGLRLCLQAYPEKALARVGGVFLGIRHTRTIPIQPPSLSPPGGRGQAHAWGALGGTYRRIVATAKPAGVQRPEGRGGTGCAAGVVSTYQRFTVKIN